MPSHLVLYTWLPCSALSYISWNLKSNGHQQTTLLSDICGNAALLKSDNVFLKSRTKSWLICLHCYTYANCNLNHLESYVTCLQWFYHISSHQFTKLLITLPNIQSNNHVTTRGGQIRDTHSLSAVRRNNCAFLIMIHTCPNTWLSSCLKSIFKCWKCNFQQLF